MLSLPVPCVRVVVTTGDTVVGILLDSVTGWSGDEVAVVGRSELHSLLARSFSVVLPPSKHNFFVDDQPQPSSMQSFAHMLPEQSGNLRGSLIVAEAVTVLFEVLLPGLQSSL